jgi:hypothetical protein
MSRRRTRAGRRLPVVLVAASVVIASALAASPASAATDSRRPPSAVEYKSHGSGYDKDQVLTVDGKPYFYNGIQVRADKLETQIGYSTDVPIEQHDPSDPHKRSMEQIFKQVAEDGYNTVNVQILWSDLQKDIVANATTSATIAADGTRTGDTLQTMYDSTDRSKQKLGVVTFPIPRNVKRVDGSKVRLYMNTQDPRQATNLAPTGGLWRSHGLKVYALPSKYDATNTTWNANGLGKLSYDGTDVAANGKTLKPDFVLPNWDPVKRAYFYDLDVTDPVAAAHRRHRADVSFVIASSTAPGDTEAATEPVSFETATSTKDDSATNKNALKQALRPRIFFSDAKKLDFTKYDALLHYAEKYGLKFEIVWFGSDTTGWTSDYRVPFYVFHKYQMTTVDQDPANVNYNGSIGTPLFEKKVGEPNSLYTFLADRGDEGLMHKEGDVLEALLDHTANVKDDRGVKLGKTLIGVQTQNEPHNGSLNGTPIKNIDTSDGLGTDRFSRSALTLAQRDEWRTDGDADHGGYKVATDTEFRKYQVWYYNDYLGKRVKKSKLPVWTRVNHERNAPTNLVDINEMMRATPGVGTNVDFVGVDTYGVDVSDMYKIGNGRLSFNIDKGDNIPVVMEDGMNVTTAAEKSFATFAGGAVHNGYNACSFDGDALYDAFNPAAACSRTDRPANATTGTGTPGTMTFAQKIGRVRLVNNLLSKVGYDLATRNSDAAGGSTLKFLNPTGSAAAGVTVQSRIRSVDLGYAVVDDPDGFHTPSRGFAIERADDEIALGTTETTTFRLAGMANKVRSVQLGSFDADASDNNLDTGNGVTDNRWTKQADAQTSVDGNDLIITVPAGDVARVLTTAPLPPGPVDRRIEAESVSDYTLDAGMVREVWNDGASAGGWVKLGAAGMTPLPVGSKVTFRIQNTDAVPGARLSTGYRSGADRATVQLQVNGADYAGAINMRTPTATFTETNPTEQVALKPGTNELTYVVTAPGVIGLDYFRVVSAPAFPDAPAAEVVNEQFSTDAAAPAYGFDKDAVISGGSLRLNNALANETTAIKLFGPEVSRPSVVDVTFDWTYGGSGNSKGGIEFRDPYGRLVFALQGATKTTGDNQLRYSTTSIDSDSATSALKVEPAWNSVELSASKVYTVRFHANFSSHRVSYEIRDGANVLAQQLDSGITATGVDRMVSTSAYKENANVQTVDNLVVKVSDDPPAPILDGKSMYAFGDSIVAGHMYQRASFPDFVGRLEGMTVTKRAVNGATVMPSSNVIVNQLSGAPAAEPDYVVFNGGTNDAYPATLEHLGAVSDGFDPARLDTNTFAGAFENLVAQLKAKYPNADLVYVAVAKLGARDVGVQQTLRDLELAICAKWGVAVADVWAAGLDTTDNTQRVKYSFDSLQPQNGLPGTAETTGSWADGTRPTGTHPNFPAIERFYEPVLAKTLRNVENLR